MPHYIDDIHIENRAIINSIVLPSMVVPATLNGTKNLTQPDPTAILITGSATGFSIILPNALTMLRGRKYELYNTTASTMLVKTFGGATLFTLGQGSTAYIYLQDNPDSVGTWLAWQIISNPDIASGILNYKITDSTSFVTTSSTDIVIPNFSLVPQAGTYAIWYNGAVAITSNNALMRASIYRGGMLLPDSTRVSQGVGSGWSGMASTMTTAQFDGFQACDIRVRSTSGNVTTTDRSIIMIRLGN